MQKPKMGNNFVATLHILVCLSFGLNGCRKENNPPATQEFSIGLSSLYLEKPRTYFNVDIDQYAEKTWLIEAKIKLSGKTPSENTSESIAVQKPELHALWKLIGSLNLDSLSQVYPTKDAPGVKHFMRINKKSGGGYYVLWFQPDRNKYPSQGMIMDEVRRLILANLKDADILRVSTEL